MTWNKRTIRTRSGRKSCCKNANSGLHTFGCHSTTSRAPRRLDSQDHLRMARYTLPTHSTATDRAAWHFHYNPCRRGRGEGWYRSDFESSASNWENNRTSRSRHRPGRGRCCKNEKSGLGTCECRSTMSRAPRTLGSAFHCRKARYTLPTRSTVSGRDAWHCQDNLDRRWRGEDWYRSDSGNSRSSSGNNRPNHSNRHRLDSLEYCKTSDWVPGTFGCELRLCVDRCEFEFRCHMTQSSRTIQTTQHTAHCYRASSSRLDNPHQSHKGWDWYRYESACRWCCMHHCHTNPRRSSHHEQDRW